MVKQPGGEQSPKIAFAEQSELIELFNTTFHWLEAQGTNSVGPSATMMGTKKGLPIATQPPAYIFKAHGDIIRKLQPDAVAILGVVGSLDLAYRVPHFSPQSGRLRYQPPVCVFSIPREAPSAIEADGLSLTSVLSCGRQLIRTNKSQGPLDLAIDLAAIEEETPYSQDLEPRSEPGDNQLTHAECSALQVITDSLYLIKQAQS